MTTTHSSFHIEMDDIYSEIKQNIEHLFIKKFVSIPELPSSRLQLLNLFLYQASIPRSLRKVYCVTTGLVQVGLDVHEEIANQNQFNEREVRARQLSILAGDYYSSQYYSLLSKANLIDGVKKIAAGIRDINVAKMKLYTQNNGKGFNSLEEMIEVMKEKESLLYIQFLDELNHQDQKVFWSEMIKEVALLSALSDELKEPQVSRHHFSYLFVNYYANKAEKKEILDSSTDWKLKFKKLYHKYDIHRKIKDLMDVLYQNLDRKIHNIENTLLREEIKHIFEQFSSSSQLLKSVVEDI